LFGIDNSEQSLNRQRSEEISADNSAPFYVPKQSSKSCHLLTYNADSQKFVIFDHSRKYAQPMAVYVVWRMPVSLSSVIYTSTNDVTSSYCSCKHIRITSSHTQVPQSSQFRCGINSLLTSSECKLKRALTTALCALNTIVDVNS